MNHLEIEDAEMNTRNHVEGDVQEKRCLETVKVPTSLSSGKFTMCYEIFKNFINPIFKS